MRRASFAVAVVASGFLLLAWAASIDWSAPLRPAAQRSVFGSEFRALFGAAEDHDGRLHVAAAAEDFSAVQSAAPANLVAEELPLLRYRFADFPRTLELTFLFRAQGDDDVQTVQLPWPGSGVASFDLSRVPAWKGRIVEIGFAEFPTAQNVPPERGFAPFDLVGVELWSPSWRGAFAALATDWFGAWPWSQRSVHALGRDSDAPHARSAVLFAALAAAAASAWAALLLGLRGRRLLVAAAACIAFAWIALDLRWQAGLLQRLALTRSLYAGVAWPQRERIVGDSDVVRAADEVKALLAGEPAERRVLVLAGSSYEVLRLIWHLSPLNAAPLPLALPSGAALPDGCIVVFYDTTTWHDNPAMRALLASSARITGPDSLLASGFESGRVAVFRFRRVR
ncbi:MAG TPA: hypothetical protein VGC30_03875 [Dokdonella sp.]